MGNSNDGGEELQRGEGYRIVAVREGSPFQGKVQTFFDFVIEAIAPQAPKTTADVLQKLSNSPQKRVVKPLLQIMKENIDRPISLKIVSTKYRKVRTIEVTPSSQSIDGTDFLGVDLRKERFDEAFDTYFPVTAIQNNSPIKHAGIREGQYLIACAQFSYVSIDGLMEGLYERFFDKENQDKTVHLVVYDVPTDVLSVREVKLKRGWGGNGLLGCDFLQGLLNKFPANLEGRKEEMRQVEREVRQVRQMKSQLQECDGVSRSVVEDLQIQRNREGQRSQRIRHLLSIIAPVISGAGLSHYKPEKDDRNVLKRSGGVQGEVRKQSVGSNPQRVEGLQLRVDQLQRTLSEVSRYLTLLRLAEHSNLS